MKRLFVRTIALAICIVPTGAQAQLVVMGRMDRGDVVYSVNEADPVARAKARADLRGGAWEVVGQSSACGYAAVWSASNGTERRYFVASGKATSTEASVAALNMAKAFVKGRTGWAPQIQRINILNENRYSFKPSVKRDVVERMVGMESCFKPAPKVKKGYTGVRG